MKKEEFTGKVYNLEVGDGGVLSVHQSQDMFDICMKWNASKKDNTIISNIGSLVLQKSVQIVLF